MLTTNEKRKWHKIKKIADKNNLFAEINDVGNINFGNGLWVGVTSNTGVSPLSIIKARAKLKKKYTMKQEQRKIRKNIRW
jgi:hypothetical protein